MDKTENCSHNCKQCGKDCPDRKETQNFYQKGNRNSSVKRVIGVVSGKGGVGKSLVTALLASAMQQKGYRCAILDADITGPTIPHMFGITQKVDNSSMGILPAETNNRIRIMSTNLLLESNTDPVLWRGPLLAGAVKHFWADVYWGDVDYMFVDMPPGTGDVPLTVFQSLPVDGIVVVTSPQELVGMIVGKAVKMAAMLNVPILGIVENMAYFQCPTCHDKHLIFGESHIERLGLQYGIRTTARLPIDTRLAAACDQGRIGEFHADWLSGMLDAIESANAVGSDEKT